jgi:amidohydrolase
MTGNRLKDKVIKKIDAIQTELWDISIFLYENPEIGFEEYRSSELLINKLSSYGYLIETGIAELNTAFIATKYGRSKKPNIAFIAEYDALPGLGHACGHNLIAAASIGAALGMIEVLDRIDGSISVIGTPAEEGGGGKKIIAKAGYFNDVDAAIMFHPANKNIVTRGSLASSRLKLEYFGKASHAAAAPEDGINALDACLLTFNSINSLRQHLKIKDRVAGIITHGGDAANIIPSYVSAEFSVRGESTTRRDQVVEKVIKCAQAGAEAVGCSLEYRVSDGYAEIIPNSILANLFTTNLGLLGRTVDMPDPYEKMGSTDMGDVSWIVPSLHPYLATVPEGIPGHSEEFREICVTSAGKSSMLDGAKAMAMTAVDLLTENSYLRQAHLELEAALRSREHKQNTHY